MNIVDANLRRLLQRVYGVRLKSKRHFKKYSKRFYSSELSDVIIQHHIKFNFKFGKKIF